MQSNIGMLDPAVIVILKVLLIGFLVAILFSLWGKGSSVTENTPEKT